MIVLTYMFMLCLHLCVLLIIKTDKRFYVPYSAVSTICLYLQEYGNIMISDILEVCWWSRQTDKSCCQLQHVLFYRMFVMIKYLFIYHILFHTFNSRQLLHNDGCTADLLLSRFWSPVDFRKDMFVCHVDWLGLFVCLFSWGIFPICMVSFFNISWRYQTPPAFLLPLYRIVLV